MGGGAARCGAASRVGPAPGGTAGPAAGAALPTGSPAGTFSPFPPARFLRPLVLTAAQARHGSVHTR